MVMAGKMMWDDIVNANWIRARSSAVRPNMAALLQHPRSPEPTAPPDGNRSHARECAVAPLLPLLGNLQSNSRSMRRLSEIAISEPFLRNALAGRTPSVDAFYASRGS